MSTGPGWDYLERLGPATEAVRRLRYEDDELFADVPDANLAVAVRFLRSAAYSATQGERKLRRILIARHPDDPDFDPEALSALRPEEDTAP